MQNNHWMQRIAEGMDLSGEAMPGLPLVEITGDRSVLIEWHRGVAAYSNTEISVVVSYGQVNIHGNQLKLQYMSKETLIIIGRIDSVELMRRSDP